MEKLSEQETHFWTLEPFHTLLAFLGRSSATPPDDAAEIELSSSARMNAREVSNKKTIPFDETMPTHCYPRLVIARTRELVELFRAYGGSPQGSDTTSNLLRLGIFTHNCLVSLENSKTESNRGLTDTTVIQRLITAAGRDPTAAPALSPDDTVLVHLKEDINRFMKIAFTANNSAALRGAINATGQQHIEHAVCNNVLSWVRTHIDNKNKVEEYIRAYPTSAKRVQDSYNAITDLLKPPDTEAAKKGKRQRPEVLIAWIMLAYVLYHAFSDVDNWKDTFDQGSKTGEGRTEGGDGSGE